MAPSQRLTKVEHRSLPNSVMGFVTPSNCTLQSPSVTPRLYSRRIYDPQYLEDKEANLHSISNCASSNQNLKMTKASLVNI